MAQQLEITIERGSAVERLHPLPAGRGYLTSVVLWLDSEKELVSLRNPPAQVVENNKSRLHVAIIYALGIYTGPIVLRTQM